LNNFYIPVDHKHIYYQLVYYLNNFFEI